MEVLSFLSVPITSLLVYAVPFIAALTIIVFIHEYGHFQVARWCGVTVEVFSIGFGREITGWNDRHGTRWKLCWIPLGGYVKFRGDANAASQPGAADAENVPYDPGNFHQKPVWQRAAVVVAGPLANFLLAFVIFAATFMFVGEPVIEPRVGEVTKGSAAERAGLQAGDIILQIDGQAIERFGDLQKAVMMRPEEQLVLMIDRAGSQMLINATPALHEEPDGFGGKYRIGRLGITSSAKAAIATKRLGPVEAVARSGKETWFIVSSTMRYLGKMVTGREKTDQLGGPISIAKAAGDAASLGPFQFIWIIAFLSVSIGLINLFPIPMLDGGHLVFYAVEALRGKPAGPNVQEWSFRIGFSLVIMLMLVGTWNDLGRLLNMAIGG